MDQEDKLYKAFLEEMYALENFRMAYAAEHPNAPLERDDPDVRRLVEAMAFFAARTHAAAVGSVVATRRRLLRQFLPYLLSPLPAMSILRATPTAKFVEATVLPRGAEIAVTPAGDRAALFRTLRDVRIMPLAFGRMTTIEQPRGLRMLLPVETTYPRNDDIGSLSLYLSYLGDFQASLRVLHALRAHLQRVTVSFEERVDAGTKGAPCDLKLGLPDAWREAFPHPVERERIYFHFPPGQLYLTLSIPPPPRNWQRFTICFDLGPGWPKNLRLTRDAFQLFTTPVVNLQRSAAQPIVHDASQEHWPLRHPSAGGLFELHSVHGVYRIAGETAVPLRSATLAGGSGSYELDEDPRHNVRRPALVVHLPESFDQPTTITVDAEWHQPWLAQAVGQKLEAAPYRQGVAGVEWELLGGLVPPRAPEPADASDGFAHILVLQNKSALNLDDVLALLGALGAWEGPFASLRDLVTDVRVREVPVQGGAMKLVYQLKLKEYDPSLQALVDSFLEHTERVLDAWISEAPVTVRVGEAP